MTEDKVREVAEMRVRDEIKNGVQMIQYQVITLNDNKRTGSICYCIYVSG